MATLNKTQGLLKSIKFAIEELEADEPYFDERESNPMAKLLEWSRDKTNEKLDNVEKMLWDLLTDLHILS